LKDRYRRTSDQLPEDLVDVGQKKSTLEAWFELNRQEAEIKANEEAGDQIVDRRKTSLDLLYYQVPEHYTWTGQKSEWKRAGRITKKIGRVYTVSPAQPELYHLS
jgi:hypothetical protein